jgi:hypothetical protein|tara:strand:+ start:3024 stop:3374 length:351 start_codon:yes stop_codon:yes gene_type:complete
MDLCYIYTLLATIIIGFHIFSIKYLDIVLKKDNNIYGHYYVILFIIITSIVSRYLLFKGMEGCDNPAIINIIVNFCVFIVLFLSVLILKVKVKIFKFLFGSLICVVGFYIVGESSN